MQEAWRADEIAHALASEGDVRRAGCTVCECGVVHDCGDGVRDAVHGQVERGSVPAAYERVRLPETGSTLPPVSKEPWPSSGQSRSPFGSGYALATPPTSATAASNANGIQRITEQRTTAFPGRAEVSEALEYARRGGSRDGRRRPQPRGPVARQRSTSSRPSTTSSNGYPHAEWAWLRKHAPVHWFDRARTSTRSGRSRSTPTSSRSARTRRASSTRRGSPSSRSDIPPDETHAAAPAQHGPARARRYRAVTAKQFTPRMVQQLGRRRSQRITREILDEAGEKGACDFVQDVSAPITIAVIAEMLGVPREDWELLFRWTNEIDRARGPRVPAGPHPRRDARARAHGAVPLLRRRCRRSGASDPTGRHRLRRRERQGRRRAARPRSSCSRTTCCSSSRATRPRATR